MQNIYNLHDVKSKENFSFKPEDYSQFKYGNKQIAKKFGYDLAKGFINTHKNDLLKKDIVILPSPYYVIPTATLTMTLYFMHKLNFWLKKQKQKTSEIVKIHREITYKEDYGNLSAKRRLELIGNDKFHVDKFLLKDKLLLFIDDIKISGSHQLVIERMIKEYNINNDHFFIYFAALKNLTIHPKIENFFNNSKIKSIYDLDEFIEIGNFKFNTRVVKFILSQKINEFEMFIENKKSNFKENLYHLAIGNGYHNMNFYKQNLDYLEKLLFNKNDSGSEF